MVYLSHDWNNIFIFVIASLALVILFLSLFFLFQDGFAYLKLFNFNNFLLKTKTKEKRININFHGNLAQLSGYECGFDVFSDARSPFDVHFYLVSILFITFIFENMSNYGTFIIMVFFLLLTLGFIYEWMQNALTMEAYVYQTFIRNNLILKKNEITLALLLYFFFACLHFLFPFLFFGFLIYIYMHLKTKMIIFYNYILFVRKKLNVKILDHNDFLYYAVFIIVLSILLIICRKLAIEIESLFFGCIVFIIVILRFIFSLFLIGINKLELNSDYILEFKKKLQEELPPLKLQVLFIDRNRKKIPLNNFLNCLIYIVTTWKIYWWRKTLVFIDSMIYEKSVNDYLNRILKIKVVLNVLSNIIVVIIIFYFFFHSEAESASFMYIAVPLPRNQKTGFITNGPIPDDGVKAVLDKLMTETPMPSLKEKDIDKLLHYEIQHKGGDILNVTNEQMVQFKGMTQNVVEPSSIKTDASNIKTDSAASDTAEALVNVILPNKPEMHVEKVIGCEINILLKQNTKSDTLYVPGDKISVLKSHSDSRIIIINEQKFAELFELEPKPRSNSNLQSLDNKKQPVLEPEKIYFLPIDSQFYPKHGDIFKSIEKIRLEGLSTFRPRILSPEEIDQISKSKKFSTNSESMQNAPWFRAMDAAAKGGKYMYALAIGLAGAYVFVGDDIEEYFAEWRDIKRAEAWAENPTSRRNPFDSGDPMWKARKNDPKYSSYFVEGTARLVKMQSDSTFAVKLADSLAETAKLMKKK